MPPQEHPPLSEGSVAGRLRAMRPPVSAVALALCLASALSVSACAVGGSHPAKNGGVKAGEAAGSEEDAARKEEAAELAQDRENLALIEGKSREQEAETKAKKREEASKKAAKKREKEAEANAKKREEASKKAAKKKEQEAAAKIKQQEQASTKKTTTTTTNPPGKTHARTPKATTPSSGLPATEPVP